jgi:hypothetical protein
MRDPAWFKSWWVKLNVEVYSLLGCSAAILHDGGSTTSETSVNFNVTTRRYIPEDAKLHTHRSENLKSHNTKSSLTLSEPTFKSTWLCYWWSISRSVLVSSPCWVSWPHFESYVWQLRCESSRGVLSDRRAGLSDTCQVHARAHITVFK